MTFSIKYRTARRHPGQEGGRAIPRRGAAGAERRPGRGRPGRAAKHEPRDLRRGRRRWLRGKRPRIETATYRDYEIASPPRLKPSVRPPASSARSPAPRIETYLAELDADGVLSRKTINDSLIPLRQILGRAVRDGRHRHEPRRERRPRRPARAALRAPDDALPDARGGAPLPGGLHRRRYRPLAEVLIGAGLRIGEAIALEWRDVDWDTSGAPRLAPPRTAASAPRRAIAAARSLIAPYLLELLRDAPPAATGPLERLVFTTPASAQGSIDRANVRRRGHDAALVRRRPRPDAPPARPAAHRRDALARLRRVDLLRPAAARPRGHPDDDRPLRSPRPGRPPEAAERAAAGGARGSRDSAWYHDWYHGDRCGADDARYRARPDRDEAS